MIPSCLSNRSLLLTPWERRDQNSSMSVLVIDEVREKYNPTALGNMDRSIPNMLPYFHQGRKNCTFTPQPVFLYSLSPYCVLLNVSNTVSQHGPPFLLQVKLTIHSEHNRIILTQWHPCQGNTYPFSPCLNNFRNTIEHLSSMESLQLSEKQGYIYFCRAQHKVYHNDDTCQTISYQC